MKSCPELPVQSVLKARPVESGGGTPEGGVEWHCASGNTSIETIWKTFMADSNGPSNACSSTISMEHIIHSEILAVTSAMRRNYRWASRAARHLPRDDALADTMGLRRSGYSNSTSDRKLEKQESDLWASFEILKRKVRDTEGIYFTVLFASVFPLIQFHPFSY